MANAAFDTLSISKDLQNAGIEEKHAEAIAYAVKQGQGDLATKQDINLLRTELRTNISWLKWIAGANFALSLAILGVVIVM